MGEELMKDFQNISIRVSKDVFIILKKTAETQHRSINQQINLFLENALAMLEEEQKKEAMEVGK